MKEERLKEAAEEMVRTMKLVPDPEKPNELFDVEDMDEAAVLKILREAVTMIEAGDTFTDPTLEVIEWIKNPTSKTAPITKTEKPAKAQDAVNIPVLMQDVEEAARISDLKEITRTEDVFKTLRGKLSSYRDIESLRADMLEVLSNMLIEVKQADSNASLPAKDDKKTGKKKEDVKPVSVTAPVKEKLAKKVAEKEPVERKKKNAEDVYTRIDAICVTLLESKPKSFDEWSQKANALYVEKGGRSSERESSVCCRYIANACRHFDIKTPKDN